LVPFFKKELLPYFFLFLLPVLVHLPALSGHFAFDPVALVSGLTECTWQTNGLLAGQPWLDANAGVTTEALGALAAHDWLAGNLPWWNPYSGVGMPLAGEGQTPAMFLPFVLLLALPHGLLALRMLLMALSGLFTFWLLRGLRLSPLPASAGAALFEMNGTFGWLAHGAITPIAFLPLALVGLEQARAGKFPAVTTLGVAWSFLAGFPETAVLNALLAAAWGGLRLLQAERRAAYALRCLIAAVAGLLIAATAIWPFIEALPRGFVGEHTGVQTGHFVAANLAQALFPTLLANPQAVPNGAAAVAGAWSRAGGYVPLAIVAVALSALRRRGPEVALRWTLAGFVAVTAARSAGLAPAVALFSLVPLLRQAAVHTYIWPAWSLAASVLVGFALQDWRDGRRPNSLFAAIAAAALSLAGLWLAAPAVAECLHARPPFYHPARAVIAGVLVTVCVLALLRIRATPARQILAVALPCGQSAGLFAFWLLAGPHGRAPDMGAVHFLQAHLGNGRVVSFGPLVPNYGAMFGIAEIAQNALPVPADWVNTARARLQPESNGILLYEGDLPAAEKLRRVVPNYEAMGADYALTWRGENLAARFPGATTAYAGTVMTVWTLPSPSPYAEAPGCTLHPAGRLVFVAACAAPSHLLRRELFDPGWTVSVNGVATAVNGDDIFQSVTLPAGATTVRFAYAPPGIEAAWFGCGAGLLLLLAGATLRWLLRAGATLRWLLRAGATLRWQRTPPLSVPVEDAHMHAAVAGEPRLSPATTPPVPAEEPP
jgi:hypothetical protein